MLNKVKIAVDAMGGKGSPKKIIEGIEISLKTTKINNPKKNRNPPISENPIDHLSPTADGIIILNTSI